MKTKGTVIALAAARRRKRAIIIHQNAEGAIKNIYVDDPEVTIVVLVDDSVADLARSVDELFTIDRVRFASDFDLATIARVSRILAEKDK